MRYEGDDASERRLVWCNINIHLCQWVGMHPDHSDFTHGGILFFSRCTGIIIGSRDAEPMWHGSKWKSLVVCSLLS
jgi:hypothetical protein